MKNSMNKYLTFNERLFKFHSPAKISGSRITKLNITVKNMSCA